jgi:hypothetical protein
LNLAHEVSGHPRCDPIADYIRTLGPWQGTAKELLQHLNEKTPESVRMAKDWVKQPRQVSNVLRRLAPALRQVGIAVKFDQRQAHSGRRLIRISQLEQEGFSSSPSSPSSPTPKIKAISTIPGDAEGDDSHLASPVASPETPNKTGPGDAGDAGDAKPPLCSNGNGGRRRAQEGETRDLVTVKEPTTAAALAEREAGEL